MPDMRPVRFDDVAKVILASTQVHGSILSGNVKLKLRSRSRYLTAKRLVHIPVLVSQA